MLHIRENGGLRPSPVALLQGSTMRGETTSATAANVLTLRQAFSGWDCALVELAGTAERLGAGKVAPRQPTAVVSLCGPFRLTLHAADGTAPRDITPGSPLRQAILAVVAAAPGQIKARRFLQEMFWGAAEPERASASLRSALYMLKLDLAALGRDVLCTDRQAVSLAPGRIAVDTVSETARGSAAFLEGMDLNLADAELFEDWLRTMRSAHAGATDETDAGDAPLRPPVAAPSGIAPPSRHGRLALGLLPTAHAGLAPADLLRADTVCDAIARLVSQTTAVPVHDMRGAEIPAVPLPVENGTGPTHLMQAVVERRRDRLTLRLRLTEGATRQVLWLSEPVDAATVDDAEVATPATDALLDRLRASPAADNAPDLFPFTALAALFSLDNALIARTEAQIDRMIDGGGPPVLHCLRAFTQVFRANEGFGRATPLDAEALCSVIGAIPLSDPMLPLCESLAGYAAHMMLGRNDIAEALLESACARAPHLALNLDHLAVLRLVQGDTDGADQALRRCLRAGAFSPWRYTYDVTGAMIAIARGDAREALLFANRAIMRKPRFLGALRYAMAGFALAGNAADARRMQARILALRPEHDLSAWTEGLLRRTPPHMGRALAASLRTNGLV